MIKKILAAFAAFLMASAMAAGQVNFLEEVTFEDLKPDLEAKGHLKDGRFPTMVLAEPFASFVKSKFETSANEETVARAWIKFYNLPETMTAEDYTRLHKRLGISAAFTDSLPKAGSNPALVKTVDRAAQATPAAQPAVPTQAAEPEKKTAAMPLTPPVESTSEGIEKALGILNGKVAALEKRGDNVDVKALKAELEAASEAYFKTSLKTENEPIARKLTELNTSLDERLAALKSELDGVKATQSETAKQVTTQAGAIKTLGGAVSDNSKDIAGLKSSVKALEGKGGVSPLVWSAIGAIALLSIFAFLRKRGGGVDMKAVEEVASKEATKVVGLNTTAFNGRLDRIEAEAKAGKAEMKEEVASAKRTADAAHKAVKDNGVWFDFDAAFGLAIEAAKNGQTVVWHTKLRDEGVLNEVAVSFAPKDDGFVNLGGVKNLADGKGCRLEEVAVKKALRKAAQRGDVVGLTIEELAGLQESKQPDFVDTVSQQPDTMPAALPDDFDLVANANAALSSSAFKAEVEKRKEAPGPKPAQTLDEVLGVLNGFHKKAA